MSRAAVGSQGRVLSLRQGPALRDSLVCLVHRCRWLVRQPHNLSFCGCNSCCKRLLSGGCQSAYSCRWALFARRRSGCSRRSPPAVLTAGLSCSAVIDSYGAVCERIGAASKSLSRSCRAGASLCARPEAIAVIKQPRLTVPLAFVS